MGNGRSKKITFIVVRGLGRMLIIKKKSKAKEKRFLGKF